MKLSLIICIYNTKKEYLSECLESIAASTLTDYEIILVDDGSELDYSDITERYRTRYIKTENRGLLSARLTGIEAALGDYIAFVDSDDTVSKNYHLPMLRAAEATGADIVINGWAYHTAGGRRCVIDATMEGRIDVRGEDTLRLYTSFRGRDHSIFVQWNKLYYRRLAERTLAILKKTRLPDKGITYGEDVLMNFYNFREAARVVGINSGFYYYRCHSEQSVRAQTAARLIKQIDSMSLIFDTLLEELKDGRGRLLREDILAWRELMARTHYGYAVAGRYKDLYPYISVMYEIDRLRLPTANDQRVYLNCELLGENFAEIDGALTDLYFRDGDIRISYERGCRYVGRIISSYDELLGRRTVYSEQGDITVPRRKLKASHLVLYNKFVYTLGARLIKKGSRLRAFLKERL